MRRHQNRLYKPEGNLDCMEVIRKENGYIQKASYAKKFREAQRNKDEQETLQRVDRRTQGTKMDAHQHLSKIFFNIIKEENVALRDGRKTSECITWLKMGVLEGEYMFEAFGNCLNFNILETFQRLYRKK
nr:hypothetical protein Iba_chr14dCG1410 [Ipomoea batatas]